LQANTRILVYIATNQHKIPYYSQLTNYILHTLDALSAHRLVSQCEMSKSQTFVQ